ncbi:MAG: response regulator transcription factor [Lewinellaceae bacterium]|nr:response regulator transcription factor [Lewinellaceae bacterium]
MYWKIVSMRGRQHTSKEIAQMLFISEKTVENHRSNIMKKLALPAEKNALLVWAVKNMSSTGLDPGMHKNQILH